MSIFPLFDPYTAKGALVLVVGPSGSGKDTLIGLAKTALAGDPTFLFPRRVITREAMADAEDHDTMSTDGFERAEAEGLFALSWGAHGLRYGIAKTSLSGVQEGAKAVINVSRGVIPLAEKLGCRVTVLSIVCDPALLAERIAKRGRESAEDIAARLKREAPIIVETARLIDIRNEMSPKEAGAAMLAAIRNA